MLVAKNGACPLLSLVCVVIIHALIGGDEGCRGKTPGPRARGFSLTGPRTHILRTYVIFIV
jgi:hypothetical protein